MEKFNDILNNIKDRFTNPLFFSFICSWIIINWEITIALLWYDSSQIENAGYNSIYSFITSLINPSDCFWKPFLFAVLYTILIPIIKNLIRALYSWATRWGEKWNLKILKNGQISIDKYIKLRELNEARGKKLEEIIIKENEYMEKYHGMQEELTKTKNELRVEENKLFETELTLTEMKNINPIVGNWENNYKIKDGQTGTEIINIDTNGHYFIYSKYGYREHIFDIKDFNYNRNTNSIFFIKEVIYELRDKRPINEHFNINRLQLENKDLLVGYENGTTRIEYKRKESK